MARAKGPEEFFEVFRTSKEDGQPAKEPDKPAPPPRPAPAGKAAREPVDTDRKRPSSAIYYETSVTPSSTEGLARGVLKSSIVLRRDSLIYAGISLLLLFILCFVVGVEVGKGRRPANPSPPPAAIMQHTPVPANPGTTTAEQPTPRVPARDRWEIQISTIGPATERNEARGEEIASNLNRSQQFRQNGLKAYTAKAGSHQVIRVRGGFTTNRGERAERVLSLLKRFRYDNREYFTSAYFVRINE